MLIAKAKLARIIVFIVLATVITHARREGEKGRRREGEKERRREGEKE